jgi:hypothetical protein
MILRFRVLFYFFLTISISGCTGQNKPQDFDYGRIENGLYSNTYFKFEMSVPPDWVIQTKEQTDALMKKGEELIAGDNQNLKSALKASEVNVANLLYASQYEKGAAVEYNPSMLMNAENVRDSPGIKSGKDYLFQARRILEQSQMKYDHIDKEFSKETIGGIDFYKMNAEITYLGLSIRQIYYCSIRYGFSLNIIISFVNDEQKSELSKSIQSIKSKN